MSSSPDIVCLGEPLIEFNRPKEGDGRTWLQGFGGDSQNVAIAAARQGASAGASAISACQACRAAAPSRRPHLSAKSKR